MSTAVLPTPTLSDDDFVVAPKKKHKILWLSDHPLCPSGVGVQSRFLIEGLLKTGNYSFRCLGGAIKHQNYDTIAANEDFIIKPVDGFGTHDMIRQILLTERPDAMVLFTDPRQFTWLWEIEDEIRQICPIAYWHVWDNDPYPAFNSVWYESTDLINCLSKKTYDLIKPNFPEKTNYIPHAFPEHVYYQLPDEFLKDLRKQKFGPNADWFIGLWVNRNATRKMPNDVLNAWKLFLDNLEKEEGHRKALLIMHTDPVDNEGPNLLAVSEMLGLKGNVAFSTQKVEFPDMNVLYNLADFNINISKAEGFGLSTLISMQVGKPIIASYTGGHIHQVINHNTGFEHGVAVKPTARSMVGSQMVPYIYDDHVNFEDVAAGMMKLYKMGPEGRAEIGKQAKQYVAEEFGYEKMVSEWDRTLSGCINNFKTNKPARWSASRLQSFAPEKLMPPNKQAVPLEASAGTHQSLSMKQATEAMQPLDLTKIAGVTTGRKQPKSKGKGK